VRTLGNCAGFDRLLRRWVHAVEWLCARNAGVNLVTKNGINVDDVPDGALLLVALLHQLHGFPGDQAQADDVRLHGAVQLQSVLRIEEKSFGDDASIVDQQIDSAANVFDPLEGCQAG
jgi:hypothetical protein